MNRAPASRKNWKGEFPPLVKYVLTEEGLISHELSSEDELIARRDELRWNIEGREYSKAFGTTKIEGSLDSLQEDPWIMREDAKKDIYEILFEIKGQDCHIQIYLLQVLKVILDLMAYAKYQICIEKNATLGRSLLLFSEKLLGKLKAQITRETPDLDELIGALCALHGDDLPADIDDDLKNMLRVALGKDMADTFSPEVIGDELQVRWRAKSYLPSTSSFDNEATRFFVCNAIERQRRVSSAVAGSEISDELLDIKGLTTPCCDFFKNYVGTNEIAKYKRQVLRDNGSFRFSFFSVANKKLWIQKACGESIALLQFNGNEAKKKIIVTPIQPINFAVFKKNSLLLLKYLGTACGSREQLLFVKLSSQLDTQIDNQYMTRVLEPAEKMYQEMLGAFQKHNERLFAVVQQELSRYKVSLDYHFGEYLRAMCDMDIAILQSIEDWVSFIIGDSGQLQEKIGEEFLNDFTNHKMAARGLLVGRTMIQAWNKAIQGKGVDSDVIEEFNRATSRFIGLAKEALRQPAFTAELDNATVEKLMSIKDPCQDPGEDEDEGEDDSMPFSEVVSKAAENRNRQVHRLDFTAYLTEQLGAGSGETDVVGDNEYTAQNWFLSFAANQGDRLSSVVDEMLGNCRCSDEPPVFVFLPQKQGENFAVTQLVKYVAITGDGAEVPVTVKTRYRNGILQEAKCFMFTDRPEDLGLPDSLREDGSPAPVGLEVHYPDELLPVEEGCIGWEEMKYAGQEKFNKIRDQICDQGYLTWVVRGRNAELQEQVIQLASSGNQLCEVVIMHCGTRRVIRKALDHGAISLEKTFNIDVKYRHSKNMRFLLKRYLERSDQPWFRGWCDGFVTKAKEDPNTLSSFCRFVSVFGESCSVLQDKGMVKMRDELFAAMVIALGGLSPSDNDNQAKAFLYFVKSLSVNFRYLNKEQREKVRDAHNKIQEYFSTSSHMIRFYNKLRLSNKDYVTVDILRDRGLRLHLNSRELSEDAIRDLYCYPDKRIIHFLHKKKHRDYGLEELLGRLQNSNNESVQDMLATIFAEQLDEECFYERVWHFAKTNKLPYRIIIALCERDEFLAFLNKKLSLGSKLIGDKSDMLVVEQIFSALVHAQREGFAYRLIEENSNHLQCFWKKYCRSENVPKSVRIFMAGRFGSDRCRKRMLESDCKRLLWSDPKSLRCCLTKQEETLDENTTMSLSPLDCSADYSCDDSGGAHSGRGRGSGLEEVVEITVPSDEEEGEAYIIEENSEPRGESNQIDEHPLHRMLAVDPTVTLLDRRILFILSNISVNQDALLGELRDELEHSESSFAKVVLDLWNEKKSLVESDGQDDTRINWGSLLNEACQKFFIRVLTRNRNLFKKNRLTAYYLLGLLKLTVFNGGVERKDIRLKKDICKLIFKLKVGCHRLYTVFLGENAEGARRQLCKLAAGSPEIAEALDANRKLYAALPEDYREIRERTKRFRDMFFDKLLAIKDNEAREGVVLNELLIQGNAEEDEENEEFKSDWRMVLDPGEGRTPDLHSIFFTEEQIEALKKLEVGSETTLLSNLFSNHHQAVKEVENSNQPRININRTWKNFVLGFNQRISGTGSEQSDQESQPEKKAGKLLEFLRKLLRYQVDPSPRVPKVGCHLNEVRLLLGELHDTALFKDMNVVLSPLLSEDTTIKMQIKGLLAGICKKVREVPYDSQHMRQRNFFIAFNMGREVLDKLAAIEGVTEHIPGEMRRCLNIIDENVFFIACYDYLRCLTRSKPVPKGVCEFIRGYRELDAEHTELYEEKAAEFCQRLDEVKEQLSRGDEPLDLSLSELREIVTREAELTQSPRVVGIVDASQETLARAQAEEKEQVLRLKEAEGVVERTYHKLRLEIHDSNYQASKWRPILGKVATFIEEESLNDDVNNCYRLFNKSTLSEKVTHLQLSISRQSGDMVAKKEIEFDMAGEICRVT